ncbi:hypothetical protein ACHAPJ_002740 [Fusarium lateritium]
MVAWAEDRDLRGRNYRDAEEPRSVATPISESEDGATPDTPSTPSGDDQSRASLEDESPVHTTSAFTHDTSPEAISEKLDTIIKDIASVKQDVASLKKDMEDVVLQTKLLTWRVGRLEIQNPHELGPSTITISRKKQKDGWYESRKGLMT